MSNLLNMSLDDVIKQEKQKGKRGERSGSKQRGFSRKRGERGGGRKFSRPVRPVSGRVLNCL